MKTLAELAAIRDKMQNNVIMREGGTSIRIAVGMGTCGIAAGARPVLNAIVEEVNGLGLQDKVSVIQTGCIGICQYEPIFEIFEDGKKTTYVKMTADKARRVIREHIKDGKTVSEYTIGSSDSIK